VVTSGYRRRLCGRRWIESVLIALVSSVNPCGCVAIATTGQGLAGVDV